MKVVAAVTTMLITAAILLTTGCTSQKEYSSQQFLMDTIVEITVFADSEEKAREAALSAFDRIKEIQDLTDRYPEEGSNSLGQSEVCIINNMAGVSPVEISDDVLNLVELSQQYNKKTRGAFDITVGPLVDLWGFGTKPVIPEDDQIQEKLELLGMDKVVIDKKAKTVFLKRKGMSIDLGGIAKGYAAEEALKVLKHQGITRAIINAGGNVVVLGKKNSNEPWKLGIQDPRDSSSLIGVLALEDQAAVTSGDYQRYFETKGVRYHHILNPASGKPARGLISATIICDSSTLADILSTAVFILGPEQGINLINGLDGVEAVFVNQDKEITVTPGLRDRISITPGEGYSYDQD